MVKLDKVVTYDRNGNEIDITGNVNDLMSQGMSLSEAVDTADKAYGPQEDE